jgi:HD-GYP domain-containing protein (c-di-GMP phosphodiesterase class II)
LGLFSEVAERFRGMESNQPQRPMPTLNDMLIAISKAMDLLEGKPLRSAMRVAVIAGSIAKMMALPERDVASIVYAALLHDIGLAKLVADIYPHLPPGVSEKPLFQVHALLNARVIGPPYERPLSDDLYQLLHQHPLAAADFIHKLCLSQEVSELVAAHHELCDGTGYPLGLERAQIPLGARILTFADVVEGVLESTTREMSGLTSRRHALESFLEIKLVGKFDDEVVAVFKNLIETHDDFLKMISSLELENMVRQLLPQRTLPMSGVMLHSVVMAMGGLSDSLMPLYKKDRSRHVADMAMHLAGTLGISREQCGELVTAALLMDIGHLATPAHLLYKAGPLTAEERAIIHDHPLLTEEVLKNIPGFDNVVLWASEHQERMNGKGYPGHRRGYEISVGGRILALADVFDALTSPRPYRTQAHEPMDALPVIGQGRLTLYDSQLVNQLRKVVLSTEIPVH